MGQKDRKLHSHILNTALDELGQGIYGTVFSTAQMQNRKNTVHSMPRRAVMASEFISKTTLQDLVFAHVAELSVKGTQPYSAP